MPPLFDKVLIIGVGQLGTSIGMNLISKKLAREVIGAGRSLKNLRDAVGMRAIHRFVRVREGYAVPLRGENDLIILATPVRTIRESLKMLPKGPLIIDVGSTKASIVKEADRRRLRFVGCHPIAGIEKGGARAGNKNLFRGRLCVVTASPRTSSKDQKCVEAFWKRLGARTVSMSPAVHDRLFAITSHLPHVLAFSLSRLAGKNVTLKKDAPFVFTSFKDATRVALSPVEMWRDIFLENRTEVVRAIDGMIAEMKGLRSLISSKRSKDLMNFLTHARKTRQGIAE